MTENNAHEVMRAAEDAYREYSWEMVKIPDTNLFVVEGTKKSEALLGSLHQYWLLAGTTDAPDALLMHLQGVQLLECAELKVHNS
jgi:hypothetical protein